jgi:D-alanyl-D-alanine dipeptidase
MKKKIATILELQAISQKENGERLVHLESSPSIRAEYRRLDSGIQSVLIRESVLHKLQMIQKQLEPNLELLVVEGYRPLAYQEQYYLKELYAQLKAHPTLTFHSLLEKTHQFVALPSVSGHPSGGAIDLTLTYQGKEVDMGGKIADFKSPELLPTYSPLITKDQLKWRMLLHDLMIKEGFAPFYGEWWHFSYGDPEWAVFYNQLTSLYSPIFD